MKLMVEKPKQKQSNNFKCYFSVFYSLKFEFKAVKIHKTSV